MKKSFALLMTAILLTSMAIGATYAKYVTQKPLEGTVTITANLGQIQLLEHEAQKQADGSYELLDDTSHAVGSDRHKHTSNNSYVLLPGVDVPKDPFVEITEKTVIPVYVYVVVDTNISKDVNGIQYELTQDWKLVDGYDDVYVYVDGNGDPVQLTDDKEIPILVQDGNGNSITVSQHLNQTVTEEKYLNFKAYMYEVASVEKSNGQTDLDHAKMVYSANNS